MEAWLLKNGKLLEGSSHHNIALDYLVKEDEANSKIGYSGTYDEMYKRGALRIVVYSSSKLIYAESSTGIRVFGKLPHAQRDKLERMAVKGEAKLYFNDKLKFNFTVEELEAA